MKPFQSFALLGLLGLTACEISPDGLCPTDPQYSVLVTVVDASGKEVITDVTVTASVDGGATQDCPYAPANLRFTCGEDQTGKFVITASQNGVSATKEVTVAPDECHVDSQFITITLGN